jgi:hypothetical protein
MCDAPTDQRRINSSQAALFTLECQVPARIPFCSHTSNAASQMKHFETPTNTDTGIESVFLSLVTDILKVLLQEGMRPAACSLVCNSQRRVASMICPRLPCFKAPAYAQLEREVAMGGASLASAFAPASMPLDGLANASLVPILSRAQHLLLICSCGHARHFIHSIMPQDIRHLADPRRLLLLHLFSFSTLSRLEDAGSKLKMKRSTGGSMLAGPQLQPSDTAWQPVRSRSSCACCNASFGILFNRRHHCRFISRSIFFPFPDFVTVTACFSQVLRAFDVRCLRAKVAQRGHSLWSSLL